MVCVQTLLKKKVSIGIDQVSNQVLYEEQCRESRATGSEIWFKQFIEVKNAVPKILQT